MCPSLFQQARLQLRRPPPHHPSAFNHHCQTAANTSAFNNHCQTAANNGVLHSAPDVGDPNARQTSTSSAAPPQAQQRRQLPVARCVLANFSGSTSTLGRPSSGSSSSDLAVDPAIEVAVPIEPNEAEQLRMTGMELEDLARVTQASTSGDGTGAEGLELERAGSAAPASEAAALTASWRRNLFCLASGAASGSAITLTIFLIMRSGSATPIPPSERLPLLSPLPPLSPPQLSPPQLSPPQLSPPPPSPPPPSPPPPSPPPPSPPPNAFSPPPPY